MGYEASEHSPRVRPPSWTVTRISAWEVKKWRLGKVIANRGAPLAWEQWTMTQVEESPTPVETTCGAIPPPRDR